MGFKLPGVKIKTYGVKGGSSPFKQSVDETSGDPVDERFGINVSDSSDVINRASLPTAYQTKLLEGYSDIGKPYQRYEGGGKYKFIGSRHSYAGHGAPDLQDPFDYDAETYVAPAAGLGAANKAARESSNIYDMLEEQFRLSKENEDPEIASKAVFDAQKMFRMNVQGYDPEKQVYITPAKDRLSFQDPVVQNTAKMIDNFNNARVSALADREKAQDAMRLKLFPGLKK
jgi:hypothetical protein